MQHAPTVPAPPVYGWQRPADYLGTDASGIEWWVRPQPDDRPGDFNRRRATMLDAMKERQK
jgi:hypothetical protein